PPTATPQSYPPEQVRAGRPIFSAQCGFCHGRDAMGGETGPDLTRAPLVAADVRGDKIGPVVRNGRADKGMPAFSLGDADLAAAVAFIHDQKNKSESLTGGRRAVDVADLQTGDPKAGRIYFDGACSKCHAPSGDLAGIARRLEGLALLQRMLYPAPAAGAASRAVSPEPVEESNHEQNGSSFDRLRMSGVQKRETRHTRRLAWVFSHARKGYATYKRRGPSAGLTAFAKATAVRRSFTRRRKACATLTVLAVGVLVAAQDSWPTYHGDYSGQ